MALLRGSLEEKYEILDKLRQGGMGAVYKVRHRLLDEVRVVKVLRSYAYEGGDAQARFLNEARMASRLRHPNLAVLHDFAVDEDGDAYLVSELIAGWTLRELLQRQGPPPLALGLETARQALQALRYLHRQGIVHRDISPDNLMLCRDADGLPQVKLIDLGIAKALEGAGDTTTGVFLGKPRYASPEQFGGEAVDERSDLYSLGVVLYELFTGRCPIAGNDPLSLMAGHLDRPPLAFAVSDPQGRIPSDLRAILFGALEKRPEDRIPSAEELSAALAAVQARYPVAGEDLEPLFALPLPTAAPAAEAEPSGSLYLHSAESAATRSGALPLAPAAAASGDSAVAEVTWGPERRRGRGLLYEPLPAGAGATASPRRAVEPEEGSPLLFRLALSTAALLVLFLFARGFWWPAREVQSSPRWADVRPQPASPPPRPAADPVAVREPVIEPASPAVEPVVDDQAPLSESKAVDEVPPRSLAPAEKPQIALAKDLPAPAPEPDLSRSGSRPGSLARRTPEPWEEGPNVAGLLKPGPGVEEPVPLDLPRFGYPAAARGSGLKADVRLALLVDERGRVIDVRVREGAPPDLGFAETALAVARRIPFQPATRRDVPGKMWTEVILEFVE